MSGLPGSGKSWVALKLAPILRLAVIDKDDILERLFDSKGVGDSAWRQRLSRESDLIFRQQSEASTGALLISHWRLPGMSPDSGTPTDWLARLSNRIVNLHCRCPVELAAARFLHRKRHPGHLDDSRSGEQILTSIQGLMRFEPLAIGERVSVDTSAEIGFEDLAAEMSTALERPPELAV